MNRLISIECDFYVPCNEIFLLAKINVLELVMIGKMT